MKKICVILLLMLFQQVGFTSTMPASPSAAEKSTLDHKNLVPKTPPPEVDTHMKNNMWWALPVAWLFIKITHIDQIAKNSSNN